MQSGNKLKLVARLDGALQSAEMSGKPFQSKMRPHADTIKKMRLARKSWAAIAQHLTASGCQTDGSQVFKFYQRHSRRPEPLGFPEAEPVIGATGATTAPQPAPRPSFTAAQVEESREHILARISEGKQKPKEPIVVPTPEEIMCENDEEIAKRKKV